ncbi:hypothetical protein [Natrinema sp. J7-1]|uniref:hypothetical protein n=1 Tax=Natrinema sp. J7-1 TaxID=1172566 RepID=UPI0012DEB211|nr:hypothetical protein [Natrinema sp. J7-1]
MDRRNILAWCLSGGIIGISGCSGLLPNEKEETSSQFDPSPFTEIEGTQSPDAVLIIDEDDTNSFGTAVAAANQTVFVGAPEAETAAESKSGAVYGFQNGDGEWNQTAKLVVPEEGPDDYGARVAGSEGTVLIRDDSKKMVPITVIEREENGWQQTSTISPSTHTGPLAPADSTAVLGSASDQSIGVIYERQSGEWKQQESISVDGRTGNDRSIRSVAIDHGTIVIGETPKGGRVNTGKAYICEYLNDSWKLQSEITSDAEQDSFGTSVAVHNNIIIVGGPYSKTVWCFSKEDGGWEQNQRYSVTNDEMSNSFGWSVDLGSQGAIIGDPHYESSGAFYHIADPTDDEREGTYYTGSESSTSFGSSVAIADNTVIVADKNQNTAYLYTL